MNNEITKNKKKFPIALILCLAIVIACAGVTAGTLILRNVSTNQNVEISEQMEISDADTLRKVLAAEGECTIQLTSDIVVTEELDVNGTKTIVGNKSIIMDTSNIGTVESVCAVISGANLILDGATIDGNGVVNGVAVKVGGTFTGRSGNIVYGYPYGITIAGTAELEGITIDRAMHTGLYVEYGGEAHMTGGVIKNNVYGLAVASGAYMSISEDAVLTKSNATVVTNYGKMEITGGTYSDCFDNVITNQGEMSIIGDSKNKIELANSKRSAIVSKKNSKLTVENCYMHDLGLHALAIEKGSEGSLVNCVIEKTGKSSFYANSSTLALKDIVVSDGESYGLSAVKQSKIEMENVTIKDMKSRGIGIDESKLVAKEIKITDTKSTGLYVVGENAVVEVEGLTLIKNGASALGIKNGKVTAKKVTIEEPKNEGVYVSEGCKLTIEDAKIHKTGMNSIMNYGTVAANNIQITDSNRIGIRSSNESSLNIKDVVIKNTASHALCVEKDSKATVTNCEIQNSGAKEKKSAVYVAKSNLNMKKSSVDGAATYAIAVKDCKEANGKVVNLNDITITNAGYRGIGNVGSYVVAGNVKILDSKGAGVYTEGTDSRTNMNQIEVVNAGACGFGFKAGTVTARNVTITTPKYEGIYVKKDANVTKLDNVTVVDPGTQGVSVEGGTVNITVDKKYNPDNKDENGVTVTNSKSSAIKCVDGGTITAQNVTVTNAKNHAFDVEKGSTVKVNGCVVDKTGKASVYVVSSKIKMENAKIDNSASYGIVVKDSEKSAELYNITITNAGDKGIGNFNSYVVAGNIKILDAKIAGIYTEGTASKTNMNQIEVTNVGKYGFGFKAGEVTARNVKITDTKEEGVIVQKDANVKKFDNVEIKNAGKHGIANFGGTLNVTVDKNYNPDNTSGNGVTIINPGNNGIYQEAGTTKLAQATITDVKEGYGIWNKGGDVVGNNVTIENTKLAGVNISKDTTVKLDNAKIIKAGDQGILCNGTLVVTNSVNKENGVTITEPASHGIYLSASGKITGAKADTAAVGINIEKTGKLGILSESGSANVSNLTLNEIPAQGLQFKGGQATIANFNIGKTGSAAIKAFEGANVELSEGTILAHSYAIATEGAEDTVSKVKATNVKVERANKSFKEELVSVGANTEFTLAGEKSVVDGKYTNETPEFSGRGVRVYGTFTMNDGTIIHNYGGNGAGVRVEKGATFTMNGGTIKENAVSGTGNLYGAGLLVQGTFVLNGGTIEKHGSEDAPINVEGAAVCLSGDSAMFTMNGGAISNNYSSKAGAGVAMRDGKTTFTMNCGEISNNHSTTNVGGIVVRNKGTFTMNEGAIISGNTANALAGGMSLEGGTTFVLNGGTFENNTAGTYGHDIYLSGQIVLAKALDAEHTVSVSPAKYDFGRVIAVKDDELAKAEFEASMKYIEVEPADSKEWIVTNTGVLGLKDSPVMLGELYYDSLEDAVIAANETEEEDTITVLENITVAKTVEIENSVKIVSDEAVTITATDTLSGGFFNITQGTLEITGASETAKISLVAGKKTTNIIYTNAGNAELENVELAGNKNSTVADKSAYGIYNNAGTVTAKNVIIKDIVKGDGINVRAGATVNIDNVSISNTSRYGIKVFGTVNIYNTKNNAHALTIQNTNDHGIDVDNGGQVNSYLTNVPENTYAIKIDTTKKDSSIGILVRAGGSVDLSDFSVKNTKKQGVYFYGTSASKTASGSISEFEVTGTGAAAVELQYSIVVLENDKASDVKLADGGVIKLSTALTKNINVTLDSYTDGATIATKDDAMSDADFRNSMKLIMIAPNGKEEWYVNGEGKLTKTGAVLTTNGTNVHYASLESAIDAATAGDVIQVCQDAAITKQITKAITFEADETITITADDSMGGGMFNITGGTLVIEGKSEEAKIVIAAGKKTTNIIYTDGGNVELENVELAGNTDSTVGKNSAYGIYNNAGTVNAKSVTIKNIVKGDGINVRAGATVNLDNVTIYNDQEETNSRYGIKCFGTVNIYNTVNVNHALTIQNTYDHAIDIDNGGVVTSSLINVPEGTYAIKIDTTYKSSAIGILVRGGGSVTLSDVSVKDTKQQGVYFFGSNASKTASGSISDFEVTGTGAAAVELKDSSATLTNGTITTSADCIKTDGNSTLTKTNVTENKTN